MSIEQVSHDVQPPTYLERVKDLLHGSLATTMELGLGAAATLSLIGGVAGAEEASAPVIRPDLRIADSARPFDMSDTSTTVSAANVSNKKRCPPGHIQLSLTGSRTISPDTPAQYTLVAKDCKTPRPSTLRNVKLEEFGPQGQKETWNIKRFHDGTIKRERFSVPAASNTNNGASSSAQRPMLKAIAAKRGKVLGKNQWGLRYTAQAPNQPPQQPPESQVPPLAPGVYLNGPLTVTPETTYIYQVEIMPSTSYHNAVVYFSVPESDMTDREVVDLTADHPWLGNFTARFGASVKQTDQLFSGYGIGVSVVSPRSKSPHSHLLYFKNFPLTLAGS